MGKVKEKLPTPDTNPVDGDKLIEATKPKKVKEIKEKPKEVKSNDDLKALTEDVNTLGDWIGDIEDDLKELNILVVRIANRMGLK